MTWLVAMAVVALIGFVIAWSIMMRRMSSQERREALPGRREGKDRGDEQT